MLNIGFSGTCRSNRLSRVGSRRLLGYAGTADNQHHTEQQKDGRFQHGRLLEMDNAQLQTGQSCREWSPSTRPIATFLSPDEHPPTSDTGCHQPFGHDPVMLCQVFLDIRHCEATVSHHRLARHPLTGVGKGPIQKNVFHNWTSQSAGPSTATLRGDPVPAGAAAGPGTKHGYGATASGPGTSPAETGSGAGPGPVIVPCHPGIADLIGGEGDGLHPRHRCHASRRTRPQRQASSANQSYLPRFRPALCRVRVTLPMPHNTQYPPASPRQSVAYPSP